MEKSDIDSAKKSKRVKRLFEEYEKLKALIKHEMEGITEIYEEYKRECFDLDTPILKLNDFSDGKEIKEAIKNIKEKAEARLAKDYIRRQMDELHLKVPTVGLSPCQQCLLPLSGGMFSCSIQVTNVFC